MERPALVVGDAGGLGSGESLSGLLLPGELEKAAFAAGILLSVTWRSSFGAYPDRSVESGRLFDLTGR